MITVIEFLKNFTFCNKILGQANKIDCFSGIFPRKTHAGCVFFCFVFTMRKLFSRVESILVMLEAFLSCGKLFSHAGNFLVMLDEFYLCGLTYSALENAGVHHENLWSCVIM